MADTGKNEYFFRIKLCHDYNIIHYNDFKDYYHAAAAAVAASL